MRFYLKLTAMTVLFCVLWAASDLFWLSRLAAATDGAQGAAACESRVLRWDRALRDTQANPLSRPLVVLLYTGGRDQPASHRMLKHNRPPR